nr:Lar family restriction alleviation protein [Brucella intermedia]
MASELKPCPFCGSSDLETYYADIEGWIAHIKCIDCDDMIGPMSEFKYETQEEAYEDASKRWNTRPTPVSPVSPDATGKCGELVTVKPLEWRKYRNGDAEAVTPFGEIYTAYVNGYWRITRNGKAGKFIKATEGDDVDAAKAGAQADFDANVLQLVHSQAVDLLAAKDETLRKFGNVQKAYEEHIETIKADNAAKDAQLALAETSMLEMHQDLNKLEANLAAERADKRIWMEKAAIEAERVERLEAELDFVGRVKGVNEKYANALAFLEMGENDDPEEFAECFWNKFIALEAKLSAAEKALEPFANAADGRKSKSVTGSVCFSQHYLLAARAALGGKPS